jgi:hypothetical protein
VNKLLVTLSVAAAVGCLMSASPAVAQSTSAPKNSNVVITTPPQLEIAWGQTAILSWDTTSPGGYPDQFAVAHCGTDPNALNQLAKSHIRVNLAHPHTRWRVRITGLKPQTTYYCTVTSTDGNGASTGPISSVYPFTMPALGERLQPQQAG